MIVLWVKLSKSPEFVFSHTKPTSAVLSKMRFSPLNSQRNNPHILGDSSTCTGRLLACPVLKISYSLVLVTTQNEHPKKADAIGGGTNDCSVSLDMARIHLPYNPWLSKQGRRNRLEDHAGSRTPYLHTCSHPPPLEIKFTATVSGHKKVNNNDGVATMYGTKHMARTCPSPLFCPSPFIST